MAEYPVHNYGSNPLGQLGAKMIEGSLDWDEKEKLLQRQALIEAAKGEQSAVLKSAESGSLLSGVAGKFYTPGVAQSLETMSANKAKLSQLEMQGKLIDNADKSAKIGESMGKSISAIMKVGMEFGEQEQKKINNLTLLSAKGLIPEEKVQEAKANAVNSIMPILEKSGLAEQYGRLLVDGIQAGKVKETYNTILDLKIAENATVINDPQSTVEDISRAYGENKQLISMSDKKPEEMKVLIGGYEEAFQAALKEKLSPAKPGSVPIGTVQQVQRGEQAVSERITGYDKTGKAITEEVGRGPKFKPDTPSEDITFKKKAQYVSTVLKIPEADAVQMVLQGKQKTKTQFISEGIQSQVALGISGPKLQSSIKELGNIYDMIQAPGAAIPSPQSKPVGKKDFKYLWEK